MKIDPLKKQKLAVVLAEDALAEARATLRAAAKRKGLSTEGIFSESQFVLRTTADRWASEAKHAALADTIKVVARVRKAMEDPTHSIFAARLASLCSTAIDSDQQPATPLPMVKPTLIVDNTLQEALPPTTPQELSPSDTKRIS